jgi:hypothetical protein
MAFVLLSICVSISGLDARQGYRFGIRSREIVPLSRYNAANIRLNTVGFRLRSVLSCLMEAKGEERDDAGSSLHKGRADHLKIPHYDLHDDYSYEGEY